MIKKSTIKRDVYMKIRLIALSLAFLVFPLTAFAQWHELEEIHCSDDNNTLPAIENAAGYINTATGYGPYINTWATVDVTTYGVPADAKAVFLMGRLLLSANSTPHKQIMTVLFAKPSSTVSSSVYQIQAVKDSNITAVRTNFATWVPLENGEFKFLWNTPGSVEPWANKSHGYYGMNTTIQCWAK